MVEDHHVETTSPRRSQTCSHASMRWKRLIGGQRSSSRSRSGHVDIPAPRSGHSMTFIESNKCILLFGGSDGKVFFDDFYLLAPTQSTSLHEGASEPEAEVESDRHPTFEWKKLVVSHASLPLSTDIVPSLSSSFGSQTENHSTILPNGGAGRDYHTMHYIPPSPHELNEERRRGARILVLGNVMVSSMDHDELDDTNTSHMFDMEEMRVEEVRIRESVVEAQWIPTRFQSMWKPRPRLAHCSMLVGDQLFVFGGKNATATTYYNDLCYFDVALNQWRNPPSHGTAPAPRAFAAMGVSRSQEQLFVYGGFDGKQQFGGLYLYDIATCRWDKIMARGEKLATRMNCSLTFLPPHHLVIFGGRQKSIRQNDVFLFNTRCKTWKQLHDETGSPSPAGRTAHTALLYPPSEGSIMIFGGYAGSHQWLNDVYALNITGHEENTSETRAVAATPVLRQEERSRGSRDLPVRPSSSSSSRRTNVPPPHSLHRSSTARVDSPTSALSDITNQPSQAELQSPSGTRTPTRTSSISIYHDETVKKRKRETGDAIPATVQTTLVELLQHQLQLQESIREVSSMVQKERQEQASSDTSRLRQQLEDVTRRCETAENKLETIESERRTLQEQLVIAEAEVYAQRQVMDEWLPTVGTKVITTIEQMASHQSTASTLLQAKVAAVHEILEELRQYSGERTEPEESPQKKDSIFPDERRRSSSPRRSVFPHMVIRDLEQQLDAYKKKNQALETKMLILEDKLKRAEMNSQRIQQLSIAWMQQEEEEEKEQD